MTENIGWVFIAAAFFIQGATIISYLRQILDELKKERK